MADSSDVSGVRFHHVHLYTDSLKPYSEYKVDEKRLLDIANVTESAKYETIQRRARWKTSGPALDPAVFKPQGQDVVDQMMHGLGFRITGSCTSDGTHTYLVSSVDPRGVKFVISSKIKNSDISQPSAKRSKSDTKYDHFSSEHIDRFYKNQEGRQGCAVLAFEVNTGDVEKIEKRYRAKHPNLLPDVPIHEYKGFKILEVYAYYKGTEESQADCGTRLRFVENNGESNEFLPGIESLEAQFDGTSHGAYFDHWVSNVVSRTRFLDTLADTLDFSVKVDFNAGVVAAGRAQIESTVTGNSSGFVTHEKAESVVDQSQVYLPTNNALSEFGHVHFFLEEIGQGIQHMASRVADLTAFISRANEYRAITGKGFSFLNIPPSYYGRLTKKDFTEASISSELTDEVLSVLEKKNIVDNVGIVSQSVSRDAITSIRSEISADKQAEFDAQSSNIASIVVRGIYSNMYKLLRDNLNEEQYLNIVKNKILVDIQNGDILYQIFTCTFLQRDGETEAPFLEFIERVCSSRKNEDGSLKPITPGCGGFGIRNFLTLFLSIEVSKAMADLKAATANGDMQAADIAQKKIEIFTSQLDKANPILTNISDAMTEEGAAKAAFESATTEEARIKARKRIEKARAQKEANNDALQENSKFHSDWMLKIENVKN